MRSPAGIGIAARHIPVLPMTVLRSAFPVSSRQHDLELVQLIPLRIGPLPFRNREQRLQAGTGGNLLWIVHRRIISQLNPSGVYPSLRGISRVSATASVGERYPLI